MNAWNCVVCGARYTLPPDFKKHRGTCFPSKEWAKENGYVVRESRWLPIVHVPPARRGKRRKPEPEWIPEELELFPGDREEDWTA